MKKISLLMMLLLLLLIGCGDDSDSAVEASDKLAVTEGTLTDARDGHVYKTVTIAEGTEREQTWMAENLNIEPKNGKSFCNECEKYGRMYPWATAMDSAAEYSDDAKGRGYKDSVNVDKKVRGICPEGWHLPQPSEYDVFHRFMSGNDDNVATKMMSSEWKGTNEFGMNVLPAGSMQDQYMLLSIEDALDSNYTHVERWLHKGEKAFFWTSKTNTGISFNFAFCEYFADKTQDGDGEGHVYDVERNVWRTDECDKRDGLSVRCVKD